MNRVVIDHKNASLQKVIQTLEQEMARLTKLLTDRPEPQAEKPSVTKH